MCLGFLQQLFLKENRMGRVFSLVQFLHFKKGDFQSVRVLSSELPSVFRISTPTTSLEAFLKSL